MAILSENNYDMLMWYDSLKGLNQNCFHISTKGSSGYQKKFDIDRRNYDIPRFISHVFFSTDIPKNVQFMNYHFKDSETSSCKGKGEICVNFNHF